MTTDELFRLIDGPLAAYLGGPASFGKFIELLNREFPELGLSYTELYPRLFNCRLAGPTDEDNDPEPLLYWDFEAAAQAYLNKE